MAGTTRIPTEPQALALLRGGARAAVTVAVLGLHLRGAVKAWRPGTMRTSGPAPGSPLTTLAKAVHTGLYRPAGMRQLLDRRPVREALGELRADLVGAGLLRAVLPGPTLPRVLGFARTGGTPIARRALKDLRARHPLPARRSGLSPEDKLLLAALHGDKALAVLAPRFTREAGLTGRGGTTERELPRSWGSSGGGGFSCGVV
ncbi:MULTISPECIES: TIGR04222 domain-containing membrane protein [unclassified Streptomyces]|uniref:TIGR04222 domain-containing membrane protein n=1 Tax=unclassified Streptomyces TaxID=2593676 RepID=UPI0037A0C800